MRSHYDSELFQSPDLKHQSLLDGQKGKQQAPANWGPYQNHRVWVYVFSSPFSGFIHFSRGSHLSLHFHAQGRLSRKHWGWTLAAALEECSSRESNPAAKTSSTPCQEKGEPTWWLSGPTVLAGCQNPSSFFFHLCYTTLVLIQNEINICNIPQRMIYLSDSIKVYRKTGQSLSVSQPILNFLFLRCNALGSCITTALNIYGSCTRGIKILS